MSTGVSGALHVHAMFYVSLFVAHKSYLESDVWKSNLRPFHPDAFTLPSPELMPMALPGPTYPA